MKDKSRIISSNLGAAYAWISMAIVILACLLILINIFLLGKDAISLEFLFTEPNPSAMGSSEGGGISTPMVGTILLTLIGITMAFPISLATAIYLAYYNKKGVVSQGIGLAVDVLAGVPTVVVGLFALAIFTNPIFTFLSSPVQNDGGLVEKAYGKSFLVAGLAMSVMILPFVIKAMTEALKTVPRSYLDASLSLGADGWRTVCHVAIPAARRGIVTGVILGMGRIVGDTAIVWLALGGTLRMTGVQPWYSPENWLSMLQNTGSTLTSYIYYTSPAGEGNNHTVAFGASLVLIVIIILLNALAAILGNMAGNEGEV